MTSIWRWILGIGVIVLLIAWLALPRLFPPKPPAAPGPMNTVDMTILGPFTYVHSSSHQTVDVAFLNDVSAGSCSVMKPKVSLRVLDGTITAPANPPADKTFPLDGVIVTFGSATSGSLTQAGPGLVGQGDHPTNPSDNSQWSDMKWVPNLFKNYSTAINPNWAKLPVVNGRVVLNVGKLQGGPPTEPSLRTAIWEFKKSPSTSAVFSQAMTNGVAYSTSMPGTSVVITLTHKDNTTSTIEIAPNSHHVQLSLVARHDGDVSEVAPIRHFCAYYQLLSTPPADSDQLLPYFVDPSAPMPRDRPVPGPMCPGDYAEAP